MTPRSVKLRPEAQNRASVKEIDPIASKCEKMRKIPKFEFLNKNGCLPW